MKKAASARFISNYERRIRIEKLLELKEWTWYKLAKEMRTHQSTVQRVFKPKSKTCKRDTKWSAMKACALALGVTVGYLVDRRPASLAVNKRRKS